MPAAHFAAALTVAAAVGGALAAPPSSATTIALTVPKTIQPCAPATISWDVSKGKAPWTVTVAPVNGLPESVTVPADYMPGKTWSWSWDVPNYAKPTSQQVIFAVSDSTGTVGGSSTLQTLVAGTGSCAAPPTELDFVWFPPTSDPRECDDWKLTWQEDRGNHGIAPPVQFAIIPEDGAGPPVSYSAPARALTWHMLVQYPADTRFVVAAFDGGKSGTGGVGQVYTVRRNRAVCSRVGIAASPGLVPARKIASPPSKSANPTSTTSGKSASTPKSTSSTSGADDSSRNGGDTSSNHSNGGAIAGGIIGALAALALIGGLLWWFRRRGSPGSSAPSQRKWPGGEVMPWKWEVVDEKPRGEGGGPDGPPRSFNVMGASSHLRRPSTDPNWPPVQAQHVRHDSQGQAGSTYMDIMSASGSNPTSKHVSKPSLSTRNVFSVVPDDALFPPPPPRNYPHAADMLPSPSSETSAPASLPSPSRGPNALERPPRSKVVADSMLFPPPAPMPQSYTNDYMDRRDPFRNPSPPTTTAQIRAQAQGQTAPPSRPVYPQAQQQQQQERPGQKGSSRSGSAAQSRRPPSPSSSSFPLPPQHTHYIPPPQPINTSIHDPYSHMSRVYSPTTVKRTLKAGHQRDFSEDASGRLPPAQYPGSRGIVDSANRKSLGDGDDEDGDGGLAYLR